MGITVNFESFEEMIIFARQLLGTTSEVKIPAGETIQQTPTQAAPTYQQPIQQAPVPAAPQQEIPTQQAPPQNTTAMPQTNAASPIQTATNTYSMDDLTKAAVMLMDTGRQADLLNLLSQFRVESLPALPQEQYGAFATALRGLGAQI